MPGVPFPSREHQAVKPTGPRFFADKTFIFFGSCAFNATRTSVRYITQDFIFYFNRLLWSGIRVGAESDSAFPTVCMTCFSKGLRVKKG